MRAHLTTLISTLALAALAACADHPTDPTEEAAAVVPAPAADPAAATLSGSQILYLQHPWVGRTVRIRDYTGDSYDRCLGADAIPAANVRLSAQLCYPSGFDALQKFTIVGIKTSGYVSSLDPMRVSLQSTYNPAYCVDVAWGTAYGGEEIQLYPCHSGSNQQFHLPVPASSGSYSATGPILTKNSSYKMAFEAGAPDRVTVKPVWQAAYSSSKVYQRWTVELR